MVALRRRLFTLLALLLSGALLFTGLSDRSSQVRANLLDLVPLNRAESPHSRSDGTGLEAVSYTHLTLPTTVIV